MHAFITKPARTAMQSGRRRTLRWRLRYEETEPKFVEPMIGWVGSRDTEQQVDLWFDTCEAAVAYAEKNAIQYEVQESEAPKPAASSYADNFAFNRIRTS